MKTFQLESMEKMQNCYLGFSESKMFSFFFYSSSPDEQKNSTAILVSCSEMVGCSSALLSIIKDQ